MKKLDEKHFKKSIIKNILKRCKETIKHDVRLSFGEDSIDYDAKKDLFTYMPSDKSCFIGKYKELYFEYFDNYVCCFKRLSSDENIIMSFSCNVVDYQIQNNTMFEIGRHNLTETGKHLEEMIQKIDELREKEMKKEENRSRK